MRIATWNVERLRRRRDMDRMLREIERADADILVLTETDTQLRPDYPHSFHTPLLKTVMPEYYRATENRVSVFSRYACVRRHETCDPYTAICVELETGRGGLLVYGTIMGIHGNRRPSFMADLRRQMEDVRRLSSTGKPICVAGDYNLSFRDSYYHTNDGRALVNETFGACGIGILTADRPECIDHVALTRGFAGKPKTISEWNQDKSLSDHKGIWVEIPTDHF